MDTQIPRGDAITQDPNLWPTPIAAVLTVSGAATMDRLDAVMKVIIRMDTEVGVMKTRGELQRKSDEEATVAQPRGRSTTKISLRQKAQYDALSDNLRAQLIQVTKEWTKDNKKNKLIRSAGKGGNALAQTNNWKKFLVAYEGNDAGRELLESLSEEAGMDLLISISKVIEPRERAGGRETQRGKGDAKKGKKKGGRKDTEATADDDEGEDKELNLD